MAYRLLIIDESLTPRIASTLRNRGRAARGVADLGYKKSKDPDLLAIIAKEHPDAVLVTTDDDMPNEHGDLLRIYEITLAVVDGRRPYEYLDDQEAWEWDIVHRWAHKMADQERGTWRRYGIRVTQLEF